MPDAVTLPCLPLPPSPPANSDACPRCGLLVLTPALAWFAALILGSALVLRAEARQEEER